MFRDTFRGTFAGWCDWPLSTLIGWTGHDRTLHRNRYLTNPYKFNGILRNLFLHSLIASRTAHVSQEDWKVCVASRGDAEEEAAKRCGSGSFVVPQLLLEPWDVFLSRTQPV